ncbi:MAG: hypothetical protein HC828_16855 [Blastochloris sp.]|nr:hypothetical protein [Blastochloris sp.]
MQTRLVPGGVPDEFAFTDALDSSGAPQAMVIARVETSGAVGHYVLRFDIGGAHTVEIPIHRQHGVETHTIVLRIAEPRLWWTWDTGDPHLEPCTAEVLHNGQRMDVWQQDIGLREITLNPDTGEYRLNGQRVFVRGTSVVPTLWFGGYDEAAIARDIALLRAAHVNGVRVCVHVSRPEFYAACDRAGMIVWQDFALQWGYAATQAIVQEAARQIRDMVRLLVNHACIALWVCQNESSFHNKYLMDPVLADMVRAEDPSTPCAADFDLQRTYLRRLVLRSLPRICHTSCHPAVK